MLNRKHFAKPSLRVPCPWPKVKWWFWSARRTPESKSLEKAARVSLPIRPRLPPKLLEALQELALPADPVEGVGREIRDPRGPLELQRKPEAPRRSEARQTLSSSTVHET